MKRAKRAAGDVAALSSVEAQHSRAPIIISEPSPELDHLVRVITGDPTARVVKRIAGGKFIDAYGNTFRD